MTQGPNSYTVFFDIDGVFGDFDHHLDAHNLRDEKGQPRWNSLTIEWWKTMPQIKGALDFFVRVAAVVETRFLTAPVLSSDCFFGKAEFVQSSLPHEGKRALMRLIIAPSSDKRFLAAPTRILIDDRSKNIEEWEAAGGIGILFKGDFAAVEARLLEIIPGLSLPADAQTVLSTPRQFKPR